MYFSTSYCCICLREYFEDVDRTWETFEKTLWGHISNFYKLSKERFVPCFEYEHFNNFPLYFLC